MCIIVAKPSGIDMPDEETLKRCFSKNPDGAGFMFADGKTVRIRKGYMTFAKFLEALEEEVRMYDWKYTAMVLHFRIATSGKVSASTCHPFPISSDPDKLKETKLETRFGVAHNGVISGRYTAEGWSDTMDFVCDVMAPLARMNPSFMHSTDALELLEGACCSKLAILDNSGEIATVGKFIEDDGVLYSNDSYLKKVSMWSGYGKLFDDEYYYEAYPQYGEDEHRIEEFMPFDACLDCPLKRECALSYCECTSEEMAVMAAEYYSSIEEEELEGLMTL